MPVFETPLGVVYGVHLHEPIRHGAEATSVRVLAVAFEREAACAVRRRMRTALHQHFRGAGRCAPLPMLEFTDGRCLVLFAAEHPPPVCDARGRRLHSGALLLTEGTQVRLRARFHPMQSAPGLVPLVVVVQIVREVADDDLLMSAYDDAA